MNFWQTLKKPIFVLAPMADVTDRAFRAVIARYGKPDVMWTEFVSADGLFRGGYDALISDLKFTETERPIVAQFFTAEPEMMEKAARLARELGFDGVDINMGCPDKSVEKQGAGASLMKNPVRATELILAAKRGAQGEKEDGSDTLPVSVKTRIGYNKDELDTWIPHILAAQPAVLTVHARTRKEMSLVPARWETVARAVKIRDEVQKDLKEKTLIFGNGDVVDITDAHKKVAETGCDGVMLGRAIFGNPWLFGSTRREDVSLATRLRVLCEHVDLFEKMCQPRGPQGQGKSFAVMKKHFKAYVSGFGGASELRASLMETEKAGQVREVIETFIFERGIS